jgi:ubiquinone/menaquinone biosynthesis C-methylase UbiE
MRNRLRQFIIGQFGNPSGLFGRFIGNGMARRNVYDATWTISLLDIQPASRVLEIGFGPGVSTQIASEKADRGFVAGIDHSGTMVQAARKRNADAIKAVRVELRQCDVSSLPYPDETFDIAFSLHSIYFWHDPVSCLRELRRVLKPGGLLAITIQPKDKWNEGVINETSASSVMTLYFGRDIAPLVTSAGYREVHVEIPPQEDKVFLACILGIK